MTLFLKPVTRQQMRDLAKRVWLALPGRAPDASMPEHPVPRPDEGRPPMEFSPEAEANGEAQAHQSRVTEFVPPGHYYSPVVDPVALSNSPFPKQRESDEGLGIRLDFDQMETLFRRILAETSGLSFLQHQSDEYRFFWDNDMFASGDAAVLAGMIRLHRPKRIIEVGSGFSSAVMLDTLDRTPGLNTALTFIEPYPARLERLLRSSDQSRVEIITRGVQEVPADFFESLEENDILFLDTTHISKTGSDVNYELFQILPGLKAGVIVHFHDIFDKFEYPDHWIYKDNRSWNEIYILRAFLMYNEVFEVVFANDSFAQARASLFQESLGTISPNPGGGLWLKKVR